MADTSWIIIDGELQKSNRLAVPTNSRGLLYGDGCFETFRSYQGYFLKLDAHLKRFEEGLNYLGIRYPSGLKIEKLLSDIEKLLEKNKLLDKDAVIRLQVWRAGKRGYRVNTPGMGHYSVAAIPLKKGSKPCRLATVAIKKIPSSALPSQYKLSNGINYIIADQQAQQQNADDALMETIEGYISETTIANIFWMRNEAVFTPSKKCDILPGVTRSITLKLLKDKIQTDVNEGCFKLDHVKKADAVWICNSVKEIVPVHHIDEVCFETETHFFERLIHSYKTYRSVHLSKEH